MAKKVFSKKNWIFLILLWLATVVTLFLYDTSPFSLRLEKREVSNSPALDFTLKAKLLAEVEKALTVYSKIGWGGTRSVLEEVMFSCKKKSSCDREIFFNESLHRIAQTLSNSKELISAGETLGIIYPGNWELADVDGDQEHEVVVLQRDAFNVRYTLLNVIDFQEDPRVISHKIEGVGYFSSPSLNNSSSSPMKMLDLTGDTIPEIILFLSSGRGGGQLFVFQYQPGKPRLIFKKDDFSYPEYSFSDLNGDGVMEIIVRGNRQGTKEMVKEVLSLKTL